MDKYVISGEIKSINLKKVYNSLKGGFDESFLRFKSEDEMFIKKGNIDLNIYEYTSGKENIYLIGGFIVGDLNIVEKSLEEIADLLLQNDIKYTFEFYNELSKDYSDVHFLKHPEW
jgi:hypothetical protein